MPHNFKSFLNQIERVLRKNATIFFTCVNLLSSIGFTAESQNQSISYSDRRALFQMAYSSMSFLLYNLIYDNSFKNQLNEDEIKMGYKIFGIANEMTAINWFNKNNIYRFPFEGEFAAVYAMNTNQLVNLYSPVKKVFQLQFSADQALFDLDENKNVRTAGTDTPIDKDIYINLKRINDKDTKIDFASALSLLIHEFGHKIGASKNLIAINSFAAKVENTIRALTRTKTIDEIRVHYLAFKSFPNSDTWLENTLFGEYIDVNIPKKIHPLTVFDNQGFYIWTEDQNGIQDISDQVRIDFKKNLEINYNKDSKYNFVEHNIILASNIEILKIPNQINSFKVLTNGLVIKMILPFMQTHSIHPKTYRLNEKYFVKNPNFLSKITNFEHHFFPSENTYLKAQNIIKPITYKEPSFQGKIISQSLIDSDYILFLQVDTNLKVAINPDYSNDTDQLWPELGINIDGIIYYLPAEKVSSENKNVFEFRIKNFNKLNDKKISINTLQFKIKKNYLTLSVGNTIYKGLLESIILLNPKSNLTQTVQKTKLNNSFVWNGHNWEFLSSESKKSGQKLRFIIESNEKIRQLVIKQKYAIYHKVKTSFNGNFLPSEGVKIETHIREIYFNDNQMSQTINGSTLIIDIHLDQNAISQFGSLIPLAPKDAVSDVKSMNFFPDFVEHHSSEVDPERHIQAVSWTTESGNRFDHNFTKSLLLNHQVTEQTSESSKSSNSSTGQNKSSLKLKCEALFKM